MGDAADIIKGDLKHMEVMCFLDLPDAHDK